MRKVEREKISQVLFKRDGKPVPYGQKRKIILKFVPRGTVYGGLYKKKGVFSALKTIIYMIK